eukprot:g32977.t1
MGVVETALKSRRVGRVLGMRFGIEGVLNDFLLDLGAESPATLKGLRKVPSSALGSSRLKLQEEHFAPILKQFRKYDIRYLFMIGGNDTMDTIHRITEFAGKAGFEMIGVGVCKTVDNDLYGTDHTPGYPSAARYVALSVQQSGLLARDMQRVDQFVIFQTVGRSAGWLPAAAALAKQKPADAPHIILLPERPFDRKAFLTAVRDAHRKYGFVSIVCGEGITNADGSPVSASQTVDKFNNVEFGAMGGTSAAMILHRMISDEFGWRGEFQVTESLQMCAADRVVKLDLDEAYGCGRQAVKLAEKGTGGVMVTIDRVSKRGELYQSTYGTAPLGEVANHERPMPDKFIQKNGMFVTKAFLDYARPLAAGKLLLTGEGSSRIFPAKSAIAHARRVGSPLALHTEAGRQAQEYRLDDWGVFALSNSGRTAEVIQLFESLKSAGHERLYSLTAFADSKLEALATRGYVLSCGEEGAVAATKSVVEQALFYRALLEQIDATQELSGRLAQLAEQFHAALTVSIPGELTEQIAGAGTIYWAGRNDGVAEELTLKTNEITRKPADFLEGTYAVHGIEEVMHADDVVIWIDPYADSEAKFAEVLTKNIGVSIIAVASRATQFPTITIPDAGDLAPFVQMAAGWNLLVETGLKLGINIDKPERARKVGNEFTS